MAYSPTTWLTGSTITAVLMNNLESQYSQIKGTYMDKFSTASTGTSLLSAGSTHTINQAYTGLLSIFQIPIGWQNSRVELTFTARTNSVTAEPLNVFLSPGRHPLYANISAANAVHSTSTPSSDMALLHFSITTTAAAGNTTGGSFSCIGGEYFTLGARNTAVASAGYVWNVKLSGTSTTLSENMNWINFSTSLAGRPTSTG